MKIRNTLKTFGVLCALLVFAAMPMITAHAMSPAGAQDVGASEFPPEYAFILGLIATVFVWGVNLFYRKRGLKISRKKLTVVLFGASLVLAGLFQAFTLPAFPGFPHFVPVEDVAENSGLFLIFIGQSIAVIFAYIVQLLTTAAALTGSGTIIYNLLKDKIFPQLPDVIESDPSAIGATVSKSQTPIDLSDFRG